MIRRIAQLFVTSSNAGNFPYRNVHGFFVVMAKGKKGANGSKETMPTAAATGSEPVFQKSPGIVGIRIHAKPGAKESAITGVRAEAVDVKIGAPPVDGDANVELVRFLAKLLDLRKSDVSLDRGSRAREKVVLIESRMGWEDIRDRLKAAIK